MKKDLFSTESSGNAVIYIRFSTGYQRDGYSSEMQESGCMEFCKRKNYNIKGILKDEGISGTSLKGRKGLKGAIASLEKGDTLVCYSISRLGRNVNELFQIVEKVKQKKANLGFHNENIDTNDPRDMVFFTIFAAFAQMESVMASERVKAGMDKIKEKFGTYGNSSKYGYKFVIERDESEFEGRKGKIKNIEMIPIKEEQEVIAMIREWFINGYYTDKAGHKRKHTYNSIASKLTEEGIKSPGGKDKWNSVTVKNILDDSSDEVDEE